MWCACAGTAVAYLPQVHLHPPRRRTPSTLICCGHRRQSYGPRHEPLPALPCPVCRWDSLSLPIRGLLDGRRDQPIAFTGFFFLSFLPLFCSGQPELVLFDDELHDNGAAKLSVKVRVMPGCWFVLLRFWLRVDGMARANPLSSASGLTWFSLGSF